MKKASLLVADKRRSHGRLSLQDADELAQALVVGRGTGLRGEARLRSDGKADGNDRAQTVAEEGGDSLVERIDALR